MSQNIALNRRKFFLILTAYGFIAVAFALFYLSIAGALESNAARAWFLAVCSSIFFILSFFASGALRSEQLELYKQIFERSNDAIAIISPSGGYILQNESHRVLVGFSDKQLPDVTPAYYAGARLKTVEELQALNSFSGEFRVEKYGGSFLDVSLSAYTVVDELKDPMFYVEIKRDIREFKKIQEEIKHAHASIKDSINYASRIQRTFLPNQDRFLRNIELLDYDCRLQEFVVHWNPKDTIGGDCYWLETRKDGFFVALIDCTGHGVPGAMMTFVTLSLLRRYCDDDSLIKAPSLMMSAMNNAIKEALNQEDESGDSNDGMDAAFLYVDLASGVLKYCGANTSLFYQKDEASPIEEIRADKSSVGYASVEKNRAYGEQTISINCGSKVYLSTDGIFDQIGGANRLSFGKKNFKNSLTENSSLKPCEQIDALLKRFLEYKGEEKQRDDNTLMAFYF